MTTARKLRPLGENQKCVLRALAGRSLGDREPRPFPGGGWTWTNYSETVAILESLERRGLAESRPYVGGQKKLQWHATPAGIEAAKPDALRERGHDG